MFLASGYFDAVTPFFQTDLDIENIRRSSTRSYATKTLQKRYYKSGHMVYLDDDSRAHMKNDLAEFYAATAHPSARETSSAHAAARLAIERAPDLIQSQYRRRFSKDTVPTRTGPEIALRNHARHTRV